ncbi:MAG: hypothetical protein C4523_07335 [Myxococcales bacterium]|nr:MAG: hypothetical protein C4523_07335 [Myxococcales bacterium]
MKAQWRWAFAAGVSLWVIVSGCDFGDSSPFKLPSGADINDILGIDCRSSKECGEGMVCVQNQCRLFCSHVIACPSGYWCDYMSDSCVTEDAIDRNAEYYVGKACRSDEDCPAGLDCRLLPGGMICTVGCASDAECGELLKDSCCFKSEGEFVCALPESCPADDGDDDEEIADLQDASTDSEPDDAGPCEPDQYRCRNESIVERCGADGAWRRYRRCSEGTFCHGGECVAGELCETAGRFCCPDTLRCWARDIQRCRSDGSDWDFYRTCEADKICVDGFCYGETADGDIDPESPADGDAEDCVPCTSDEGCAGDLEYCFIPDPRQTGGCCTCFCDTEGCPACPRGFRCEHGECAPLDGWCQLDAQCDMDEFCNRYPGHDDGVCKHYCFVAGEYCPETYRCEENPSDVNYGRCVPNDWECRTRCTYDGMCQPGYYCEIPAGQAEGCCIDACASDYDCPNGLHCCEGGRCGVDCGATYCDPPCDPCYECAPIYNTCSFNCCPPCPEGYYCDETTAPNCREGFCTNPPVCGIITSCCPGYRCSAIVYGVLGFCI